jgi:transposase
MNTKDTILPSQRSTGVLFPIPVLDTQEPVASGRPRVRYPDRHQVVMQIASLDSLLPQDHRARLVWEYVQGLDLSPLYQTIRSVDGRAGRDAIDPGILLALWLYATWEGVGSARQLDRLGQDHVAYRWLGGGVSVNYHTLSDFCTAHAEFLDDLLTQSVATLIHEGLVTLHRVAQDGMRVRASAGAAQERSERIRKALGELAEIESKKKAEEKEKTRASTTDPEARVMKMADGGFRPAHNVQFASDTESQVITGVDVVNTGSDQGQMSPMVEQHQERYGRVPGAVLVDGGFAKHEDIEKVSSAESGTKVYAPVQKPKKDDRDPHEPRPGDSEVIAEWRQRMGTPEAKEIYKDRASTAECVNAISRNRGLRQFLVRGVAKVRAVALWFAFAHNLMRAVALRAQVVLAAA